MSADDRWSRHDWWGVVLDAPDVAVLTRFYAELTGWSIHKQDDEGSALDPGEGVAYLAIQHNPDYVAPTWPGEQGRQQMMLHLDFEVTDLAEATARAEALGATLAGHCPRRGARRDARRPPAAGERPGAARPGRSPVLSLHGLSLDQTAKG